MKEYPSISAVVQNGVPIYAFPKHDGSNLRAEFSPKTGFNKFGKRHGLLDDSNPILKRGIPLMQSYEDVLGGIFRKQKWERVTCYFEFYGAGSFAGSHVESEQQVVSLFDVDVFKRGLLEPSDFVKLFRDTPCALPVLYMGSANQPFVDSVRNSTLDGMPLEGVVCKGAHDKKAGMPLMFKIKSLAWLQRLKQKCGDDDKLFQSLA